MKDHIDIEQFLQPYIARSRNAPELAHLIALECDARIRNELHINSPITFSNTGFRIRNEDTKQYEKTPKNPCKNNSPFTQTEIASTNGLNLHYANQLNQKQSLWLYFINKYIYPQKAINKTGADNLFPIAIKSNHCCSAPQKVSIIMTAFNAMETIKYAAESILGQTHSNLELIIVNDNSSDSTEYEIKKIAANDNRVVTVNNKRNMGAYISRNLGLALTTGEYVTCHDADDYAFPNRIERQLDKISKEKTVASICHMLRMTRSGQITRHSKTSGNSPDGWRKLCHISMMYETKFFKDKLGHWDSVRAAGDSEIINRTIKATNGNIAKLEEVLIFALDADGSTTRNSNIGLFSNEGKEVRRKYKEAWLKWHNTSDCLYMPFPALNRPFPAPAQLTN